MYLIINKWKGRLGNNIQQIVNAIKVGLMYNYNIIIPEHSFFTSTKLIINKKTRNLMNNDKYLIKEKNSLNNFFLVNRIQLKNHPFDKNKFSKIKNDEIKKIIFKYFKLNIDNYLPLANNVLVIYIRSGDIFKNKENPNPKYISAPFYFYDYIIKTYKNKYQEFYLISEDKLNPVIQKLLNTYSFILHKNRSLEKDITKVIRSHDLVSCYGTFIPGLLFVKNNIKNIYIPDFIDDELYKNHNINIIKIELPKFYKTINSWKNTQIQNDYLIKYQYKNKLNFTISGKNDGFGAQYLSIMTGIAWCHKYNYNYIHTKFKEMEHNVNIEELNNFIGIPCNDINKNLIDMNVPYVYDIMYSKNPNDYYTPEVLNKLRKYYYSTPKPFIDNKNSIVIHIRRGDVSPTHKKRGNTNQYYINIIKKLKNKYNNYKFIIESEGNENDFIDIKNSFINLNIQFNLNKNIILTYQNFVSAPILVIAKSALSYSAGLLNKNIVYYIPNKLNKLQHWINIDKNI